MRLENVTGLWIPHGAYADRNELPGSAPESEPTQGWLRNTSPTTKIQVAK